MAGTEPGIQVYRVQSKQSTTVIFFKTVAIILNFTPKFDLADTQNRSYYDDYLGIFSNTLRMLK